jgi:hypothetical protein
MSASSTATDDRTAAVASVLSQVVRDLRTARDVLRFSIGDDDLAAASAAEATICRAGWLADDLLRAVGGITNTGGAAEWALCAQRAEWLHHLGRAGQAEVGGPL